MKFTLKDYQEDAVSDVLNALERAKSTWHRDGGVSSLALTAPTGAGKTVMAAAAIEALFFGSEQFDADPDEGAVVLWFSDDPSLNEQTRGRLMDASEKFTPSDLVTIEYPFDRPKLDPGKVYFLNTGKLTKSSLLTRGHVMDPDAQDALDFEITPDMQATTIWQTIANTIDDEDRTLYLVLDEAHRGFNTKVTRDKSSIVQRLVNGHAGHPPIPIVWGISATIERFQSAMKEADAAADRRRLFPPVNVDPNRVQESGLVKDVVSLKIPDEAGNFDTVLVTHAAQQLVESTRRWAQYSKAQGFTETVVPLLVLQVPDTPDPDDISRALDAIAQEYTTLGEANVAHVLGEQGSQRFGAWNVQKIAPQDVQDATDIRVLVAKSAISTGWDCPRAEVMVSFRPAKDATHITQLLGRMVRNPLARSVPGDERLNTVECILPFFDRTTAVKVVQYLTGQREEMPGGDGKKVLLDGRELGVNPNIPDAVWQVWDSLPTQTLPKRGARPVKRLVTLAHALAQDGVVPGALTAAEQEMHVVLDTYAVRYKGLLDEQVAEVHRVDLTEILGSSSSKKLSYRDFSVRADDRAIRSAFEDAKKAFGADIAQSYVNHLAGDDDGDDDLRDAYVRASALATVKEVREKVDQEATALVDKWFAQHRVALKSLPDTRQEEYKNIRAMTTEPQRDTLSRPRSRMEEFSDGVDDALEVNVEAPLVPLHLMSTADGLFPLASLNDWERRVVQTELERPGAVGWYRNPPRGAGDSFAISYRNEKGNWASLYPDFLFFHEINGQVRASIVDPHGHHLPDALIKLRALADFAEQYGDSFHRIEMLSEENKVMRVLDMTIREVRDAVRNEEKPPIEFYRSDLAIVFDDAGHHVGGRTREGDPS